MNSRCHPIDVRVGANLRRLRLEAGMSQAALAHQLGVTFQQVQKYENGTNRMSASRLWTCAQVVGVSVEAFFLALDDEIEDAVIELAEF